MFLVLESVHVLVLLGIIRLYGNAIKAKMNGQQSDGTSRGLQKYRVFA